MAEEPEKSNELQKVPSKTDEELKQFVRDFIGNRIFSMHHIPDQDIDLLQSIFMVVALGGLAGTDLESIGTIYAYMDTAGPLGVNGYPTFFSCHLMNKEDWARCAKAIDEHTKKLANIEV